MKQLRPTMPKIFVLGLLFVSMQMFAQKQNKTYSEKFNVGTDAVLDINTSYADIEFETWDRNEVSVEAIIELDGATEEEAEAYFKNSGIKILGNSKAIEISTFGDRNWGYRTALWPLDPVDPLPSIAAFPDMEQLFMNLEIPELPPMPEMPPVPPIPNVNFDYEAFKKDGEKYMKKWQKEFNKSFDKDYQKKMEAWGKEFATRAEAKKELLEERRDAMEGRRTEMEEQREHVRQQAQEIREQAQQNREQLMQAVKEAREKAHADRGRADESNIFFRSEDGASKSYKIKKTIRIKMPKSATLKMNVRHGEVKLAANTRNMNATLAYASLQATSIEGDRTQINASYSPVKVAQWKLGNLNTNFSEAVELEVVSELNLTANSSEVVINRLLKSLVGRNDLGMVSIKAVDPNFSGIDMSIQNGELHCTMPSTPFSVMAKNTRSEFKYPDSWTLNESSNGREVIFTGYSQKGAASKKLALKSAYSTIILK